METTRLRIRRSTQLAVVALLVAGSVATGGARERPHPVAAQGPAPFTIRYSVNAAGDIAVFGNTVLTCPAAAPGCLAAQTDPAARHNNQDFVMEYVDVDADPSTVNSSTNPVTVPDGATVLFAALYWGGQGRDAALTTVLLDGPGAGGYQEVDAIDHFVAGSSYQAVADVTAIVAAEGMGDYTVGSVHASEGSNQHGGWAMVVVYEDGTAPFRNLTVFDGFDTVTQGQELDVTVSDILTPLSGDVAATVGIVAYEGDNGRDGDSLLLDGVPLGGGDRPADNFFNSHRTRGGATVSEGDPDYVDQLGLDLGLVDATGLIANGADSATFTFTTASEQYFPGVLTSAIDLFAPDLGSELSKSVTDDDGGVVEVGDVLTYRIASTNAGLDASGATVLTDELPAGVTYVPGSVDYLSGSASLGAKTDEPGDDEADYDAASRVLTARLGAGASATEGGSVAPGEGFEVALKVTVDPGTEGLTVANTITLRYVGALAAIPFELTVTPPEGTLTVVRSSDLSVELTGPAGPVPAGGTAPFAVVVGNGGPSPSPPTSVVLVLPPGLALDPEASDPSCAVDGPDPAQVSCPVPALDVGASVTLPVVASVASSLGPGDVTTSATVAVPAGTNDPDPANDVATVRTPIVPGAELRVTKVADVEPVAQGGRVVYTITVENLGPRAATGVVLDDALPDGLRLQAQPDGCTVDGALRLVRCELGTLGVGATRSVALDAVVEPDVPPGTVIQQTASATAVEVPGPVTATAATTVIAPGGVVADLSLTKLLLTDVLEPGRPVAFEVAVANGGPDPATVVVVDRVATGLEDQVWSCASPGCGVAGGTGDMEVEVTVAAGETVVLRVDATVSASAPASVFNLARLVLPPAVADPAREDNAALVLASTVPNSPPAAPSATEPVTIAPGETIVIDPFDYVSDADGSLDPSTVCVVEVRPAADAGAPGGGCGAGSVVGAVSVDPVTGAISYTAPETLDGPLVLSFEVCDLRGGCVQVTLVLAVAVAVAGPGLATTGADLDRLAVAGLLIMGAGAGLLLVGARRRLRTCG